MKRDQQKASARIHYNSFDLIADICSLHHTDDWKIWYDNYGNKIELLKTKLKLTKEKSNVKINDIYIKSDKEIIFLHSYWYCLFESEGEDYLYCFMCSDGRLRVVDNDGVNISPIELNKELLDIIINNYTNDKFIVIDVKAKFNNKDFHTAYTGPVLNSFEDTFGDFGDDHCQTHLK